MNYPLVTFLSPCYNHSKYVIESLNSIKEQTYPNIQHIIIDDCSKDDSSYKIQKWMDENEYKCHFIQHKSNRGISFTLNESIEMANGEFWTALATDDYIKPERTQKFVSYLLRNPDVNMVTSDCKFIDENSKDLFKGGTNSFLRYYISRRKDFDVNENFGTYESLLVGNYIPSSLMLRKSIFEEIGVFDVNLKMEDWKMWLRVSSKSKIHLIDEFLTHYRYHDTNSVFLNDYRRDELITFLSESAFHLPFKPNKIYWKMFEEKFKHSFSPFKRPNESFLFTKYVKGLAFIQFLINKFLTKLKAK